MQIRDDLADARMARSDGVLDYWPWLLRYPVSGYCLPVVLMLALFASIALGSSGVLPFGLPDAGLPLLGITVIWTLHYLLRVIEHTTQGYATPPPMTGDALYLAGGLKPLVYPALVATAWLALRAPHPVAAQIMLALSLFVLPAYLFSFASERSLLTALNPLRWVGVIAVMGLGYLLPCLLLAGGAVLLARASGPLGTFLPTLLFGLLLFGTAHLLGYLGFRRHRQLSLHLMVRHPDEVERERAHAAQLAALLQRLDEALLAHDEEAALHAIETDVGGPLGARDFFEQLFCKLATRGTPALQHAAGRRLITALLADKLPERAMDVAEACLGRHPHFTTTTVAELEALARQALVGGHTQLFERLLAAAAANDDDPRWLNVQFLRVRNLAEAQHDDAAALLRLQPLLRHSEHPQHARLTAYGRTLRTLASRKPSTPTS